MGIYQREGSKNWWLRYRDASGKLRRLSAGTTNKSLAQARLAELEAEVLEEIADVALQETKAPKEVEPDTSLDARIAALETMIRRILLERESQIRFLQGSANASKQLLRD